MRRRHHRTSARPACPAAGDAAWSCGCDKLADVGHVQPAQAQARHARARSTRTALGPAAGGRHHPPSRGRRWTEPGPARQRSRLDHRRRRTGYSRPATGSPPIREARAQGFPGRFSHDGPRPGTGRRARPGALQHLLLRLPRLQRPGRRHDRAARLLPPAGLLPAGSRQANNPQLYARELYLVEPANPRSAATSTT